MGESATLSLTANITNILDPGSILNEEIDYKLINVINDKDARYFILIINNCWKYRWIFIFKKKTNAQQIFIY
jgi:hypothetical protein